VFPKCKRRHVWDGCVCMLCGEKRDEEHEWIEDSIYVKCTCPYDGSMNRDRTDLCTKCQGRGSVWRTVTKCKRCGIERSGHVRERMVLGDQCSLCHGTGKNSCSMCNGSGTTTLSSYSLYGSTEMKSPCIRCRGTGLQTCTLCNGKGK